MTKKCVKRVYFFVTKAHNASDALKMSKTVFWEEKGTYTFEIDLSHEKGIVFSQSFLPNLYHDT